MDLFPLHNVQVDVVFNLISQTTFMTYDPCFMIRGGCEVFFWLFFFFNELAMGHGGVRLWVFHLYRNPSSEWRNSLTRVGQVRGRTRWRHFVILNEVASHHR